MADDVLIGRIAVVMAHPDDEILWASSILAQVDRIVICFGDVASKPALSAGRRAAMAAFPLPSLRWLALPEAGAYNSADWPDAKESPEGVVVRRRSAGRYRANFDCLKTLLRAELAGCDSIVTHNPWGEYGHEEHVQVFRAVDALREEMGFSMWVSSYASNRSAWLMQRWLPHLGSATPPRPTDTALARQLRDLYLAHDCWTWTDDYAWPDREVFFRWTGERPPPPLGTAWPLNVVWRDLPRPGRLRRVRHRLAEIARGR